MPLSSPMFFVQGTRPSAKPTLRERKAIDALRSRGFELIKDLELKCTLIELFQSVKLSIFTDDDMDELTQILLNANGTESFLIIPHPYFWKRIGFTCEYPERDFKSYTEPAMERVRIEELTPISSRWNGGMLTMDCLLFFLQHPDYASRSQKILSNRSRRNELSSPNYRIIIVAMEIVRSLGLLFCLFSSVTTEPQSIPRQPNMKPFGSFCVDWVDKEKIKCPSKYYPFRSFWSFATEPNGFQRLFCSAFMLFDFLFIEASAISEIVDPISVMGRTGFYFEEILESCNNTTELEERLLRDVEVRRSLEGLP